MSRAKNPSIAVLKRSTGAEQIGFDDSTVSTALKKRARVVESRAEMKPLDVQEGFHFILSEGGRSGLFKVKTGTPPADPEEGIYVVLDNGRYAERDYFGALNAQWFGLGDGSNRDAEAVQAAVDFLTYGIEIRLPKGNYTFNSTVLVDTTGQGYVSAPRFVGDGISYTEIDNQSSGAAFKVTSGTADEFAYALEVAHLTITSTGAVAGSMGIELLGARFVHVHDVFIDGMGSHGIYGLATIGDLTDSSYCRFEAVQIKNCGGYGIYAEGAQGAIQYGWNLNQCRIGLNALGGILLESMVNCEINHTGIYYNQGFGLRVRKGTSGVLSKNVRVRHCEFDTNDGTQCDLVELSGGEIEQAYLIANQVTGVTFAVGIAVGSAVSSTTINKSTPRLNPALSGLKVHTFAAGSVDTVVRDTVYDGYSVGNGDMYEINEPSTVIDDRNNRQKLYTGTYAVEVTNSAGTVTSPTTITGHYTKNGDQVLVGFRNLNNVDLSGFAGADYVAVSLPYASITGSTAAFVGACVITSDGGGGDPMPVVENGGQKALFARAGSNAFVQAGELSSGVSDIARFTLGYMAA